MNLVVQYANGAQMSYSLNAFSPWEGYRVAFTGTKGRIELDVVESVIPSEGGGFDRNSVIKEKKITVFPMFGAPYRVEIPEAVGSHGGADPILQDDIFLENPPADPYNRAAGYIDGCMSVLTGIAANKSIATGLPIEVSSLVDIPGFKFKRL